MQILVKLQKKQELLWQERRVSTYRGTLLQVHDTVKQGLITYAIQLAREKGVSAYIGKGVNRWPAVHVSMSPTSNGLHSRSTKPASRYNAVAEEGVPMRAIG